MNLIAGASAQNFASTDSAFGPCSAISARSASGSMTQVVGEMRAQMRLVLGLAGGVDDQEQVVAEIRDHQIVENAAVGIGELGVALPARRNRHDVLRHQPLQRAARHPRPCRISAGARSGPYGRRRTGRLRCGYAGAPSARRPDIAPACRSPRTAPSCRRARHAAREGACVSGESWSSRASIRGPSAVPGDHSPKTQSKPHLSLCLRVLSRRRTPSGPKPVGASFQMLSSHAVRLPESFRGGCSFGAGTEAGLSRRGCLIQIGGKHRPAKPVNAAAAYQRDYAILCAAATP